MAWTWRGGKKKSQGRKNIARKPLSGRAANNFGRHIEKKVRSVLERMTKDKLIDGFVYHKPNSQEDQEGRDFTVVKGGLERSFDVTGSINSKREKSRKDRPYPSVYIHSRIAEAELSVWILQLFNS